MKPGTKWQLEEIPLKIKKVPVHFKIKRQNRNPRRPRSASKENQREAGTCISPRVSRENHCFSVNCSFEDFSEVTIGGIFENDAIREMPSHLEESPRKLERTLICKAYLGTSALKTKKNKGSKQSLHKSATRATSKRSSSRIGSKLSLSKLKPQHKKKL